MSVFDQLAQAVSPHANRLNQTIASSAVLINNKLDALHRAMSDLGRPDIGDRWSRFAILRKFAEGEKFEIPEAQVPVSEVWLVQALVVDGVQNKSPAFIVCTNDETKLFFSVIKEGIGTETVGGDMAVLPGETIFILARAAGTIGLTLHIVKKKLPNLPGMRQAAEGQPILQGRNTHEVQRDLIASATGEYIESPPETALPPHEKVVTRD